MNFSRDASPIVQKIMEKQLTATDSPLEEPLDPTSLEAAAGTSEPEPDMASLMADYEQTAQKGRLITGRVVKVESNGVMLDIGTKSDGYIPIHELEPGDELKPGDEIEVLMLKPETDDGGPLLSKRRADYEKAWLQLVEAYERGQILEGLVKDLVKGGLVVDLGMDGFVPASHVATKKRDLSGFVGQVLKLKIIDVDRKHNKLILSNRVAVEEEREKKKKETWARIEEGKILPGIVRRITDFGAFVDLGGVDGLLHISDMAWTRLKHPSEAVKVGEKLEVLVLEIDRDNEKLSLGLKQLLPDPWKKAARNYRTGRILKGVVTRIVPACAFISFGDGIDGIIPVEEVAEKRAASPDEVLRVGQEVEVKVMQVRVKQRRMTLSLKEAEREKEKREFRQYMDNQKPATVTLGDVFGELLATASGDSEDSPPHGLGDAAPERVVSSALVPNDAAEAQPEQLGVEAPGVDKPVQEAPAALS